MLNFIPAAELMAFNGIRKDYLEFCRRYFFPYLDAPFQEEDYYYEWNDIINSRDDINKPGREMLRLLEEIARGHSKTLFLNILLSIYDAVTGKYDKQAVGGATNGQTKEFADTIKRTLLKSPYLRYMFVPDSVSHLDEKNVGSITNTQWNNDKIILKNGSIIYFRSMQQEWSGLHVQKATIDDGVPKKQSKIKDSEVIRTFQFDLIPTLKSLNADLIVIGTPVRKKDLLNHIKSLEIFKIHRFKAISDFDLFKRLVNDLFKENDVPIIDNFESQCKWLMKNQQFKFKEAENIQDKLNSLCLGKNRFGWKGYMQTYVEVGKNAFMREYLMEIVGSSNQVIESQFIELAKDNGKRYPFMEQKNDFINSIIQVWDYSFSKSNNADKTSCVMMWKDRRNEGKIFTQLLWEAQPKEYEGSWKKTIFTKMKEFYNQYKPDVVIPEGNSILQLTDDLKSLGLPLKPIWTGNTDTTLKKKMSDNKNFNNMITIDKSASVERLGTAFENEQIVLVYGDDKAKSSSDNLAEQLESWCYDEDDDSTIIENGVHPDAGICVVLGNEHYKMGVRSKVVGGFL